MDLRKSAATLALLGLAGFTVGCSNPGTGSRSANAGSLAVDPALMGTPSAPNDPTRNNADLQLQPDSQASARADNGGE